MAAKVGWSSWAENDECRARRLARAAVDMFADRRSIVAMKVAGALLLTALAAVAVAGDLLVRIELASDVDIAAASAPGVDFLDRFDGWFLVRAGTDDLAALSGRASCRVLDADIEGKRYVYAFVEPGFDRARLAACGMVLTEDREGALLRVTAEGVRMLTRMPVELCGVSTEPILSSPTSMSLA